MLTRLHVKDFAIATEVDIDLGPGLGVISGETGAGKSLLVDALLLLSGTRADSGVVRHGAERAELSAEFELHDAADALAWLRDNELDDEQDCQIRRVIRADGGSKAWINGRPASATQLGELAERLVEIHGQHEHQALLDRAQQTRLLDSFGRHEDAVAEVARCSAQHRQLQRELQALQAQGDVSERVDYLAHQVKELQRLQLAPEHIADLLAAHRRQAAGASIVQALTQSLQWLGDESPSGARAGLRSAVTALQRAREYDAQLDEPIGILDSALIQLDEAAAQIERIHDALDLDPAHLAALDAELQQLHDLARKHRVGLPDLQERRDQLEAELHRLHNAGSVQSELQAALRAAHAAWSQAASQLSALRRDAATVLEREVGALMGELGMAGGRLLVQLEPLDEANQPHANGAERVELCVSANIGQPPRPLRRVASGGELARISLAIEVATRGVDGVSTMVFDEVDSGIGGAVAEVVGQKLRALAGAHQVLCVTHLAQVAAQGHSQFRVSKREQDGLTRSEITLLDSAQRVEELARMIGGVEITDTTRAHAQQMLERAQRAD